MDIRRGAVVLNQTADGTIRVAYAGPDIYKAKQVYRDSSGPGVWTLHESHRGQAKRYPEPVTKPEVKLEVKPEVKPELKRK